MLGRDEVVGEAAQQRIARADRVPGERQVGAQLAGCGGEEVGSTDVGHKADSGLRHGDA